jgi:biotin carboxyl carrier protein
LAGRTLQLRDGAGREHRVEVSAEDRVIVNGVDVNVSAEADGSLYIQGTRNVVAWTIATGDTTWVFLDGEVYTFELARAASRRRGASHHGALTAPMPATVRKVGIATGDAVRRGDVLIVLEAMKMELPVRADADGVISAVHCREGEMVQAGQELAQIS